MTLTLVTPDAGHQAAALRLHRGNHASLPTGECERLVRIVPEALSVPAGPAVAVEIPFRFALWLASGVLVLDPDAMDALYYQYVPCIERIGAAIDKALSGVSGDSPRSASQLRKEMRRAARRHRAAGMGQAYLVSLVDLYEVANAFPTGVGVDHCYDWIGLTSLGMLIDNEDSLTVAYGSLEQCLGLRFDAAAALAVNGPLDMLTRVIQSASDQSDALLMTDCTPQELATEVSAWVLRVQPVADELTYLCGTPLGALQLLRRQLSASHDGGLGDVVATNVGGVLRHFPLQVCWPAMTLRCSAERLLSDGGGQPRPSRPGRHHAWRQRERGDGVARA